MFTCPSSSLNIVLSPILPKLNEKVNLTAEKWPKEGIWTCPGKLPQLHGLYSSHRGGISHFSLVGSVPCFIKGSPPENREQNEWCLPSPAAAGRYLIPCFVIPYLYCCFIQLLFHAKCTQSPCSGGRVWIMFQLLCQKWCCLSCIPHAPYISTKHVFISIEANKYSFVICLSLVNSFFLLAVFLQKWEMWFQAPLKFGKKYFKCYFTA